jgi:hypothetical protein
MNGFPPRVPLDLMVQIFSASRRLPFRVLSLQTSRSLATCSLRNGWLRSTSAFGTSGVCHTPHLKSSEVTFPEVSDLSTRVSWQPMTWIYFGLRLFGDFTFSLSTKLPKCSHSRVVDLTPPVPLDDGWSLTSSGLWDFDNPYPCALKGIKVHALYLDQTTCRSSVLRSYGWDLFLSSTLSFSSLDMI